MGSSSRNSRKPYVALGLTAAVSLLAGTAALAGSESANHNFVLTAYSNGKGGADLISGNYEAATKALQHPAGFSSFDASTSGNNRCVMLTMTRQWDAARTACNEAVRSAQQEKLTLPSYQYWARKSQNDYLAVALSNRAVLHWLSSENAAAETDLKRAKQLSPKAGFVTRNLAALQYSQAALAQVGVAPVSP